MKKTRPMLRWAGIAVLGVMLSASGGLVWAEQTAAPTTAPGTPDQITINTLAPYGKLELPPVTYLHDVHTQALAKENKGCETCHYLEASKLSFTYLRHSNTRPEDIKDIYHATCIGCHAKDAAAGKKTGPLDGFCRSCHNANLPVTSARLDAGLDKVLHYRHLASKDIAGKTGAQDNCGACHHEYDQATKKLVSIPGQEGSCRYCHLQLPHDGIRSLQQAAHEQCLTCHQNLAQKGVKGNLPVTCNGCHSAEAQAAIAKADQELVAKLPGREVPRLKRNQPDATLVMYEGKPGMGGKAKTAMPPVPFNHAAHEKYSDNCRVCHHASMEACSKCHTLGGSPEGGNVTFEQAMHRTTSQHSCEGCHTAKQAAPNCAGCHNNLAQARPANTENCQLCHMSLPGTVTSREQKYAIAETMLKNRKMTPGRFAAGEIPDKVIIGELSNKFEPVQMDHLHHINKLLEGSKDSQLANYFHNPQGTLCQGCHHNSPASKTPPNCGNCHAQAHGLTAFKATEENRPGLLAAQHNQCMGCHKQMGVKPVATACTECHREKHQDMPKMVLGAK
jgi:hypothetical protein